MPDPVIEESPLQTGIIKGVEVFAAGTWNGSKRVSVDSNMLDRMVSNFSSLNQISGFGVPVKLGHNTRVGEPAMGWVTSLERQGNTLLADLSDVPLELVDKIGKRQYNNVSVEIWPKVDYQGQVYTDVLGAVALLGSEWPAVKGLKPLSASVFAEIGVEKLELNTKEPPVTLKFTQEEADALVATAVAAALAAKDTEIAALTQRVAVGEAALKTFREDNAKVAAGQLIDAAIKEGKVLPKQRDELMAMAEAFGANTATKFKVGTVEKTGLEMFQGFIAGLPVKVSYGERARSEAMAPGDGEAKIADIVNDKVQEQITASAGKMSYEDALAQVFRADPALKTRYAQEG
jgi:hypothetical protein